MSRGIAKRSVFDDRACVRYFLSCLARVVRAGLLEIHAYSILTNHFHLLVRSPEGRLGEAMRLALNRYVRWFNRRSQRDGALFRGRYRSRPVETFEYRCKLVAYIDGNPVEAGLVELPELYSHGSAYHYARTSGPIWLERSWIEPEAIGFSGLSSYSPEAYREAFSRPLTRSERQLVEARLDSPSRGPDPLDDLLEATPARVARRLRYKAMVADGTNRDLACAAAETVVREVEARSQQDPDWRLSRGRVRVAVWRPMTAGLLRDLAATRFVEAGARMGLSESGAKRAYQAHAAWMQDEPEYARVVGEIGKRCLGH